ncbi:MAG: hypothetical protein LBB45_08945 [Methanobrevibacter sp.]|jgi:hypothetical protein|nr:hypothetical protein [Candidatus Methanovirga basalitermitum]
MDALNKFKEFINNEKDNMEKSILVSPISIDKTDNGDIGIYNINSNQNQRIINHHVENDVNLILNLLEKDKKEKSKIEIYRDKNKYKKEVQRSTISKKRFHEKIKRNKRFKNREFAKKKS